MLLFPAAIADFVIGDLAGHPGSPGHGKRCRGDRANWCPALTEHEPRSAYLGVFPSMFPAGISRNP